MAGPSRLVRPIALGDMALLSSGGLVGVLGRGRLGRAWHARAGPR
jgi:hypothetical protein